MGNVGSWGHGNVGVADAVSLTVFANCLPVGPVTKVKRTRPPNITVDWGVAKPTCWSSCNLVGPLPFPSIKPREGSIGIHRQAVLTVPWHFRRAKRDLHRDVIGKVGISATPLGALIRPSMVSSTTTLP